MAIESTPQIALGAHGGRSRTFALPALNSAGLALGLIVATSTVVRTIGAMLHPAPTYFPDEYIYTALARSLGSSGLPLIRGSLAHFPSLLAPLAAAPIWALAPTTVAYRLVQAENTLFMSLAAVPVYLLARTVGLERRYSLACALFAVAIPDLAISGRMLSGPIGYPLALAALYAAVVALTRPTRRSELAFLAIAFLATFARVQYVVLPAAYFGALLVTRRRDALRTHRLSLAVLVAGTLGVVALGPGSLLGFYGGVLQLHAGSATLHWIYTDLFLIAVASGAVLVPGALVGLATARGRTEVSFAVLAVLYAAAVLFEAGLYASNGSGHFQERYLFSVLPLIPIAFGLYLKRRRPMSLGVLAVAALLLLAAAHVPLSGFAVSTGSTDSPLLWAMVRLQSTVGIGSASLLLAVYVAVACAVATLVAFGLRARVAFASSLVFLGLASLGATVADANLSADVRSAFAPASVTWVDDARLGNVTAVGTWPAPDGLLTEQLFWNRSVTRELLLGNAQPTDVFVAPAVRIAPDGTLRTPNGPLRTPVLFEQYGVTATFQEATRVARTPSFALWRPRSIDRLALLENRFSDGWLAPRGSLTLWPRAGRPLRGVIRFRVSMPPSFPARTLTLGDRTVEIRPGSSVAVALCVDSAQTWTIAFHSRSSFLTDFRRVGVQQTMPRFVPGARCTAPAGT